MAVVKAVKHQSIYLQGAKFPIVIYMDYINLRTFLTTKVLDNRRLARWAKELSYYNLQIKYIKGVNNSRANALSQLLGYKGGKVYKEIAIFKEDKNGDLVLNTQEIAELSLVKGPWDNDILKA